MEKVEKNVVKQEEVMDKSVVEQDVLEGDVVLNMIIDPTIEPIGFYTL